MSDAKPLLLPVMPDTGNVLGGSKDGVSRLVATSAEDDVIPVPGPPLVVPLLMADPLEKQSETIFY